MPAKREDWGRPVTIHICKDGTISYRRFGQKVVNGVALPVFTVDTEEQAETIQIRFGRLQYERHPDMPDKPWYKWTDFSGKYEDLEVVTDRIREFYAVLKLGVPV